MRIVSWNMGAAFGPFIGWHDQAWHWLAVVDPDLAFIQECVPPTWARQQWTILTLPFTHWASALVTKVDLGLRPVTLEPASLPGRFGSYLATGEIGADFLVASVHTRAAVSPDWVTAGHDRTRLARSTVGVPWSNDVAFAGYEPLANGRSFIIGGDWNTARYPDAEGVLNPQGAEFFARAERAGWVEISLDPTGQEGRSWYGQSGPRPYQPDHIFADSITAKTLRSAMIDAYPVVNLGLSDHAPLIVELEANDPAADSVASAPDTHPILTA